MENRPTHEGPTIPMNPTGAGGGDKVSVFEDFVDIFYAPGSVYERRQKAGFGLTLLIVSLVAAVFAFSNRGVMSQIFDAEYDRRIAKMIADNPQIPAQQQQAMASMKPMQMKIQAATTYVATPIWIFVVAFALWLVAMIVKARVTYAQAVLITTLAFVPRQLGSLAMTLQVLLLDTSTVTSPYALTLSPARFMDRDTANAKVYALLGSLDAFRIWTAALEGIGIAVMARAARSKGWIVTGIVFVLFSLVLMALG